MKYDCCFTKESNWFRYRTGGILLHDDKMLFVKCAVDDYYYMVGGEFIWAKHQMPVLKEKFLKKQVFMQKYNLLQL